MRLNTNQIQHLAEKIFAQWKQNNLAQPKVDEKKIIARISEIIKADYDREVVLEKDVNAMMDKLEKENPGQFQRFKMFPLLKQKLAKERKIIL